MGAWGTALGISRQAWVGRAQRGSPHACTPALGPTVLARPAPLSSPKGTPAHLSTSQAGRVQGKGPGKKSFTCLFFLFKTQIRP